MEDDTLANAITYILLLRVKSFPKMYVTLCPPKWYHSPPLAHALYIKGAGKSRIFQSRIRGARSGAEPEPSLSRFFGALHFLENRQAGEF